MKIEAGKFYRTRNGRKARIYATDGDAGYSVHGALWFAGEWILYSWTSCGRYLSEDSESPDDLVSEWREPLKFEGWVVVKRSNGVLQNAHREFPCGMYDLDRYAIIRVSGTEDVE